jgi:hypothetical protein
LALQRGSCSWTRPLATGHGRGKRRSTQKRLIVVSPRHVTLFRILSMSFSRRDFLERSAALAAAGFVPRRADDVGAARSTVSSSAPAGALPPAFRGRPLVVSSSNGLRGVKVAYDKMVSGEDPLDAAIAGVNIQELDPDDQSVGLGGLPNEEGVVQVDASCMHGPTRCASRRRWAFTSRIC